MTRRMLVDAAHSEELRVVVVNDEKIEDFEVETAGKEQVKGNIYVAEVARVEPSLQAAFVDYGGNRNGFLAFSEIHPQWFDLPEEEKQSLIQELEEIATRRRKKTEEIEEKEEQELEAREKSDAEGEVDRNEELPVEVDSKVVDGPMEAAEKSEAKAKEAKAEDSDSKKEEEKKPRRRGRPRKADKEKAEAEAKAAAEEASKEEKKSDEPELSQEEIDEDARALAIANSMAETPLEDETKEEKPKRGRRPRRHAKKKTDDESVSADNAEVKADSEKGEKSEGSPAEEKQERKQAIHRRYNIADVVKEGQKILIQVNKEERGNKGAAVSTFISLPGRFVVLMPNTPYAGGISRKITDLSARRKLKKAVSDLKLPDNMGLIVRTAGVGQEAESIQRDVSNLLKHWEKIEKSLKETKSRNKLVHEDGSLIIRAARDMLSENVDEINISGRRAYRSVKDYVKAIMPEMAKIVKEHRAATPIFTHYGVEEELNHLHRTRVDLPSGGYLIINPTEALVSIDVNSGRATQEKNIEETALKTNLESAEEVCRQLRLRDLAGLVVIDFIDMEDRKNERAVERAMRKAVRRDRARVQLAPISQFGLMEMSRQRLRPSLGENTSVACPHCNGAGFIPSPASAALMLLRGIEEEISHAKAVKAIITTSPDLAVYVLNHKRDLIRDIEARYKFQVLIQGDVRYIGPDHRLELVRIDGNGVEKKTSQEVKMRQPSEEDDGKGRRRRRGGRGRGKSNDQKKHDSKKEDVKASEERSDSSDKKEDSKGRKEGGRTRRGRRPRRSDKTESTENSVEAKVESPKEEASSNEEKKERKPRRTRRTASKKTDEAKTTGVTVTEIKANADAKPVKAKASDNDKDEKKPRRRRTPLGTRKAAPKKAASKSSDDQKKGVVMETVTGAGEKKVEEVAEKSAVGKAFQRWWGKASE